MNHFEASFFHHDLNKKTLVQCLYNLHRAGGEGI